MESIKVNNEAQLLRALSESYETVIYQGSTIHPRELENAVKVLKSNTVVKRLNFAQSGIAPRSVEIICSALYVPTGITHLELSANNFGDNGAIHLARSLKFNDTLQALFLSKNQIGDEGAQALGEALRENGALQNLNLQENLIGDEGALALITSLQDNHTLTELSLYRNNIKNAGPELVNALEQNTYLKSLHVSGNSIENEIVGKIQALLQRNVKLEQKRMLESLKIHSLIPLNLCKLMVVGEGAAGKTATVRSLLGKKFKAQWDSTIGISLTNGRAESSRVWRENTREDHAASLLYNSVKRQMHKTKKKRHTGENSEYLKGERIENRPEKRTPKPLGKTEKKLEKPALKDQDESDVQTQKPDLLEVEYVRKLNTDLLSKAKADDRAIRFTIWDYGGQSVFFALHHLFLTKYGIYMLVFNMQDFLIDEVLTLKKMRHWLQSIKLHASEAPILLVGTFRDGLVNEKTDLRIIDKVIKSEILPLAENILQQSSSSFFPVSNKYSLGLQTLRKALDYSAHKQEFVRTKVPARWLLALNDLLNIQESWIRFDDARALVEGVGIHSMDELDKFLEFFHEIGMLVFFATTEALHDIITLQPQWLLSGISKLIRDPTIHKFDEHDLEISGLKSDADKLIQNGFATRDFLEYVWGKDESLFLIDFMQKMFLMNRWTHSGNGETYFVPSMVQKRASKLEVEGLYAFIKFEFLPYGIFERLLCLCVEYSQFNMESREPQVFVEYGKLWFGLDTCLHLLKNGDSITVVVCNEMSAGSVMTIILSFLSRIRTELLGNGFKWNTFVVVDNKRCDYEIEKARSDSVWCVKSAAITPEMRNEELDTFAEM